MKKKFLWGAFAVLLVAFAIIQFAPSPAVIVPSQLPPEQRAAHRVLNFEGIHNFRDLGGYRSEDGRTVRWGKLYRSANFHETSRADQQVLAELGLAKIIDFRSAPEKEEEPNQFSDLPPFAIVEIPTMDGGDNNVGDEIMQRIESGDMADFDPNAFMIDANRQFAYTFTPQFSQFIGEVIDSGDSAVAWHCSAGKDRTGYAAAILLRLLGVPMQTVMEDYMLSKQYALEARRGTLRLLRIAKGDETADKVATLLGVETEWLEAAFDEIDERWGSFENYTSEGLGLTDKDIQALRNSLLE
ncbi:tyrosine-protein phosphatase [Halioglobus maricola]|uniref:tyrosine-protein phosphatase n=1 Tax=Halioglobus maricola TaxID=2601894 RepID=UPI0014791DB5|nr:tyrosine-protein phosphatase [Halioglobus maricola]